jgi:hypothetical protein
MASPCAAGGLALILSGLRHIARLYTLFLSCLLLLLLLPFVLWLCHSCSMASPCAAGGLALILSGLKAHGAAGPKGSSSSSSDTAAAAAAAGGGIKQWISPNRVRRAVEATCMPLGGASPDAVLTYGRGLLQVGAGICMAPSYLWQRACCINVCAVMTALGCSTRHHLLAPAAHN